MSGRYLTLNDGTVIQLGESWSADVESRLEHAVDTGERVVITVCEAETPEITTKTGEIQLKIPENEH